MIGPLHPAYVAGIVDGEGCIGILRTRAKDHRSGWKYQLQICVVMREKWLMEALQRQYGGSVWAGERRQPQYAPVARWRIGDRKAGAFLRECQPFLKAKREQSMIALHFLSVRGHQHRKNAIARVIQEDCFWCARYANRRGVEKAA